MGARYDLVVIGGGTAGLVAAHIAGGLGARVALVEAARTGGDCLWTGCVPSKRLIAAASTAHSMRTADRHGLEPANPPVDLARVMKQVRVAQDAIEPHDSVEALEVSGVEVVRAHARFVRPGLIDVGTRTLEFRTALIASGSRPVVPPVDGLAATEPLTSDSVWDLDALPRRLLVLGGGAIGCELGQAFQRLGATVSIVEALDQLLPREEPDVGSLIRDRLRDEGVEIRTGARLVRCDVTAHDRVAVIERNGTPDQIAFDRILVAVGRRARTDALGLDTVGVEISPSGDIRVDARMRTTGDRIFAAGDVTGKLPFTHVAAYQARVAVTNALLRTRNRVRYDRIPTVTFTDPEVARVGMSVPDARRRWGNRAVVQLFEYEDLDRAVTHGDTLGFARLVASPRQRLVGATIVGQTAGESVAEITAWIVSGARVKQVSRTVHAYPTFAEGPSRAADEVLRATYLSPRVRRITVPMLRVLRALDRPRDWRRGVRRRGNDVHAESTG